MHSKIKYFCIEISIITNYGVSISNHSRNYFQVYLTVKKTFWQENDCNHVHITKMKMFLLFFNLWSVICVCVCIYIYIIFMLSCRKKWTQCISDVNKLGLLSDHCRGTHPLQIKLTVNKSRECMNISTVTNILVCY